MSLLADTTSLIAGSLVASVYPGLGAPGSAILAASSAGDSGAGPLAALGLSGNTDYYWVVTSAPASGVLRIYEDGSFSHTSAADGPLPWTANVYANGVLAYTLTITDTFGVVTMPPRAEQFDYLAAAAAAVPQDPFVQRIAAHLRMLRRARLSRR